MPVARSTVCLMGGVDCTVGYLPRVLIIGTTKAKAAPKQTANDLQRPVPTLNFSNNWQLVLD
jgi:hypothetical protein